MHYLFIIAFLLTSLNGLTQTTALINGRIYTAEEKPRFVQALVIKNGIIVAAGSNTEAKRAAGPQATVIDLQGRLVVPGFNDAHTHFLTGSMGLLEIDLSACANWEECKAVIRHYAAKHPEKEWLTGAGWQYSFFAGGMPHKAMLDSLVPDKPVYIRAYDGHSGWANTKALALAKVDRNTPFTGFGAVIKDAAGEPTGVFTEGAQSLVRKLIAAPATADKIQALRMGMQEAAKLGITSIQNASGSVDELALYDSLLRTGELTVRTSIAFSTGVNTSIAQIEKWVTAGQRCTQPRWLKAHAIKFMLDGVIESHTATMLQPYSDLPAGDTSHLRMAWPAAAYEQMVRQLDSAGFQLYTHALGDAAVRQALQAYKKAATANNRHNGRHRIEHIEQVAAADIPLFAKQGVLPSMQPIHADPGTIEVWAKAVGSERLPRSFAWRSFLQSKAALTFGSDWPACISPSPIRGIHNAVNRQTPAGVPPGGWVPAQRITVHEALRAYTYTGAYASFDESWKGRLLKGYAADLVVLSQDVFQIAPKDIHATKVLLTMVGGKVVYDGR